MSVVFHASHTIGPTPSCHPAGHCTRNTPPGLTGAVASRCVLAYLSSCESAQTILGRTEELAALVRAFFYAGSPSVIASLWSAYDATAAEFAAQFYRLWTEQRDQQS